MSSREVWLIQMRHPSPGCSTLAPNGLHCRQLGHLLLVPPQAEAKLKTNGSSNNQCSIEILQLEQMYLDDPMFIVPMSSPNFGNAMLYAAFHCHSTKIIRKTPTPITILGLNVGLVLNLQYISPAVIK